ncbi:hypothetical protein BKA93DRAFT_748082 [Sparassis latifolia]
MSPWTIYAVLLSGLGFQFHRKPQAIEELCTPLTTSLSAIACYGILARCYNMLWHCRVMLQDAGGSAHGAAKPMQCNLHRKASHPQLQGAFWNVRLYKRSLMKSAMSSLVSFRIWVLEFTHHHLEELKVLQWQFMLVDFIAWGMVLFWIMARSRSMRTHMDNLVVSCNDSRLACSRVVLMYKHQ